MAARISIARAGRLVSSLRPSPSQLQPQIRTQCLQRSRQFSAFAAVQAKRYSEDHEWVELSADKKSITLGISSYAAAALGDVIYVELPQSELEASAGEAVGAVESVKSANDIMTPVAGKVIEANNALEDKPSILNQDPEGEGWLAKLEIDEAAVAEVEGLMDEAAYKKYTEDAEEAH